MPHSLEARFEAQVEELKERLHDCLHGKPGAETAAAQSILKELIAGYQLELSHLRRQGLAQETPLFIPPASGGTRLPAE